MSYVCAKLLDSDLTCPVAGAAKGLLQSLVGAREHIAAGTHGPTNQDWLACAGRTQQSQQTPGLDCRNNMFSARDTSHGVSSLLDQQPVVHSTTFTQSDM